MNQRWLQSRQFPEKYYIFKYKILSMNANKSTLYDIKRFLQHLANFWQGSTVIAGRIIIWLIFPIEQLSLHCLTRYNTNQGLHFIDWPMVGSSHLWVHFEALTVVSMETVGSSQLLRWSQKLSLATFKTRLPFASQFAKCRIKEVWIKSVY